MFAHVHYPACNAVDRCVPIARWSAYFFILLLIFNYLTLTSFSVIYLITAVSRRLVPGFIQRFAIRQTRDSPRSRRSARRSRTRRATFACWLLDLRRRSLRVLQCPLVVNLRWAHVYVVYSSYCRHLLFFFSLSDSSLMLVLWCTCYALKQCFSTGVPRNLRVPQLRFRKWYLRVPHHRRCWVNMLNRVQHFVTMH